VAARGAALVERAGLRAAILLPFAVAVPRPAEGFGCQSLPAPV